jgi:wyosine [tRNA(Phe)-imidazoG37] synthetase (radical SAM superfamily)
LVASGRLFEEEPFSAAPETLRRLNDLAFSGNGEPTAAPAFPEACRVAVAALERHGLGAAKTVVITNATLLGKPEVAEALRFLDAHGGEVWAKLDAGTEECYRRVNRSKVPFAKVLENILEAGRERTLVIQTLFMRMPEGPPSEEELAAYLQRLSELRAGGCRIGLVQLYTLARATAVAGLRPLGNDELGAIAARIRALGLPLEIFGAPA